MTKSPEALEILISFHDLKQCEADAMGYKTNFYSNRIDVLKKQIEKLNKESD